MCKQSNKLFKNWVSPLKNTQLNIPETLCISVEKDSDHKQLFYDQIEPFLNNLINKGRKIFIIRTNNLVLQKHKLQSTDATSLATNVLTVNNCLKILAELKNISEEQGIDYNEIIVQEYVNFIPYMNVPTLGAIYNLHNFDIRGKEIIHKGVDKENLGPYLQTESNEQYIFNINWLDLRILSDYCKIIRKKIGHNIQAKFGHTYGGWYLLSIKDL
jgi:hypothetical protein